MTRLDRGGGSGRFHRSIVLINSPRGVQTELVDDFHHFTLTLEHDGAAITSIKAEALRYPWSTCAEAPGALAVAVGRPLPSHPVELFSTLDPRQNCTHLFELLALAAVQAGRAEPERRYELEIADPVDGVREARLCENQSVVLAWTLLGNEIRPPSPWAGLRLHQLNRSRLADLGPVEAERVMLLRRAGQTAGGRQMDVDAFATAAELGRSESCFTLLAARRSLARRVVGSARDASHASAARPGLPRTAG